MTETKKLEIMAKIGSFVSFAADSLSDSAEAGLEEQFDQQNPAEILNDMMEVFLDLQADQIFQEEAEEK